MITATFIFLYMMLSLKEGWENFEIEIQWNLFIIVVKNDFRSNKSNFWNEHLIAETWNHWQLDH